MKGLELRELDEHETRLIAFVTTNFLPTRAYWFQFLTMRGV